MKKCIIALGVLMISFFVSACSGRGDSSAPLFTVGGVVSGLSGTLVLQNNGGDDLAVTENGLFTFPTGTAPGSSYTVTVRTNPTTQTCIVSNGTGTLLISSVTNVSVDCFKRGGLDVSFNSPNGFAVHNSAAAGNGDDFGNAVAVYSRGRILSAGSSTNSAGNADMAVWRYNADGTLDTTFNSPNGFVVQDGAAGGNADDYAHGIAVDSLGKVLVTGSSKTATGNTNMVIWRFKADGTLDTDFNRSGIVSAAVGTCDQSGNAIAVDSWDRILVTGSSKTTAGHTDMVIWRFNANGTVDTGFNNSGIVSAAVGTRDQSGNAIAVDSQDRILVTGSSRNSAGNTDMVIWRFKPDGTLDTTSFNSPKGFVVHNSAAGGNGDDSGNAIVIDSDGKIVVTGTSRNSAANPDMDMVIWRYKTDGNLDTAFNGTGIVINNGAAGSNGDDSGNGIAIDSQGRILVTGSSKNSTNTDMVVWRFNADGSLDITFAAYGILAHNSAAAGDGDDSGNAIAVDSQDRILVAGSSKNSAGNSDMVIWKVFP